MYYGIVVIATILFGIQFFCNQQYEKESGNGAASSMLLACGSSLLGGIVLLVANGFCLSSTPFTFILAVFTAINNLLCMVCGLKALGCANLSLFSLFSMLGGMVLPFVAGIVFYNERFTWNKGVCLLFVVGSLLLTLQQDNNKGGGLYFAGIFVCNGMAGVLSKIYQEAPYVKANEASYSIWSSLLAAGLAGIFCLCLKERRVKITSRSILSMAGSGALNKVANLLLLIALAHLPASVQYPMVTGGVIIVSTLFSYFTPRKPTHRELGAVALAFLAVIFIVL